MADVESFFGWVGACQRCGLKWFVHTGAMYVDGRLLHWGMGGGSDKRDPTVCTNFECYQRKPYGKVRPLATLEEQEPYRAAYAMGGETAVFNMLEAE